jgi:hypothetical protein
VQYSYLHADLKLWRVQTRYERGLGGRGRRPAPDLGAPAAIRRRGTAVARVTHALGLSSTGTLS